jgi:hypothetical protein
MTPAQQAYGLLWLSPQGSALVKAARDILRDTLSLEERQQAAQWAMKTTRRTAEGLEF